MQRTGSTWVGVPEITPVAGSNDSPIQPVCSVGSKVSAVIVARGLPRPSLASTFKLNGWSTVASCRRMSGWATGATAGDVEVVEVDVVSGRGDVARPHGVVVIVDVSIDGGLADNDGVLVARVTRWDVADHHLVDSDWGDCWRRRGYVEVDVVVDVATSHGPTVSS